jgi:hypothetical protein
MLFTVRLLLAGWILCGATAAGGAVYYIDPLEGDDSADGRSPAAAWRTFAQLAAADLKPGQTIRLRRGGVWREALEIPASGEPGRPITFEAYGDGPLPLILGSESAADPEQWREIRHGIWATADGSVPGPLGHVAIDDGRAARRVYREEDLAEPWDLFHDTGNRRALLRADANPATLTSRLEVAVRPYAIRAHHRHHLVFRELDLRHAAIHGFSGYNNSHVHFEHCDISWIGGATWEPSIQQGRPVGFGNGIEFGGNASWCTVTGCRFDQIYDSAITHQNWDRDLHIEQHNITFRHNIIRRSAVGIEVFAHSGRTFDCTYEANLMQDIGRGFSGNGGLWATGFRIVSSTIDFENLLVRNNRIENSRHCGLFLSGGEVNVQGNTILDCDIGIYITGQDGNRDYTGTARGNLIADCDLGGIYIVDSAGPARFLNNTIVNNGRHQDWNRHNVTLDGATNTIWVGNILYSADSFAMSINDDTHILDHNVYYRPGVEPVVAWENTRRQVGVGRFAEYQRASGQDANSIAADPMFINMENGDYRLQPDSPAAGAGFGGWEPGLEIGGRE